MICASPKASCRSVSDFAWEVSQAKRVRVTLRARLFVFRNPYRRLISAFLNKYVEHSKYRQASMERCPQARLDTFADFVDELDRWGFRCVDKVHFRPQVRRYRGWRFDRVFDADDLELLRRYVNGVCGTDVAMPFRVRQNRPRPKRACAEGLAAAGGGSPSATADLAASTALVAPPDAEAWSLPHGQLRPRLAVGQAPSYAAFYNPELAEQSRRIYRADFQFLDRALRVGLLEEELHARLTSL